MTKRLLLLVFILFVGLLSHAQLSIVPKNEEYKKKEKIDNNDKPAMQLTEKKNYDSKGRKDENTTTTIDNKKLSKNSTEQENDDEQIICTNPDFKAEFNGGGKAMGQFIDENLKIPVGHVTEVVVYFSFVIEKDGSITNVQIFNSPGIEYNTAVLDIMSKMPKWIPAKKKGINVRAKQNMSITFKENKKVKT